MDFDLGNRASKLAKEQERRRLAAKQKIANQKKIQDEVKKRNEILEKVAQDRRIEELKRKEEEEAKKLEEERLTGGIQYSETLRAVPTSIDGDKITLPVSALERLNPQNALEMGALVFEVKCDDIDHVTHAGVLEFSAEEGTVGIPPKVARSLLFHSKSKQNQLGDVQIRFVRIGYGRATRIQPRGKGFGERMLNFKETLERVLKTHTTLTEGDIILVRQGKETVEVIVREVVPEGRAKILNVDLEVDLLPSEEVEKRIEEKEKGKRRIEMEALKKEKKVEMDELERIRLKELLPTEPPGNLEDVLTCSIRLPDGKRLTRKVSIHDKMEILFWFIVVHHNLPHGAFHLSSNYPRRTYQEINEGNQTFSTLGFRAKSQEAFFVEIVKESDPSPPESSSTTDSMEVVELHDDNIDNPWIKALQELEHKIDENLIHNVKVGIHELEPSLPVHSHLDGEKKWEKQLEELAIMGFTNSSLNVEVLERYQGRLLRVVNYLSELN